MLENYESYIIDTRVYYINGVVIRCFILTGKWFLWTCRYLIENETLINESKIIEPLKNKIMQLSDYFYIIT